MDKENNKVIIYARRSSLKNRADSISIEHQINEIKKECESKWLEVIWEYSDNESSYKAWKRDDFDKMLLDLKERNIKKKWDKVDYLFVYMVSRLARNREESNIILDLVEKENLKILSQKEFYEEGLKGQKRLAEDLNEAIYESREKSEDGKIHMDETQKKSWKIARKACFWYTFIFDEHWERKRIINTANNEDEVVRKVFELYKTGKYSYESLADYLNKQWYTKKISIKKTKTIKYLDFTKKDTENIIVNPLYYGRVITKYTNLTQSEIKYFREEYPDLEITDEVIIDYTNFIKEVWDFTPIISKKLFDECLDVRQWRKWKTSRLEDKSNWPIYLFQDLFKCPCRKGEENLFKYTQEEKTNKKYGSKTNYYKCSWWNKDCINKSLSEKKLEAKIQEEFINAVVFETLEIQIFEDIIYQKLKDLWKVKEDSSILLKQKISNIEKEESKYYNLYADESNDRLKEKHKEKWMEMSDKLERTKNQLKNLSAVVESKEDYIKDYIYYINKFGENFDKFPKIRKRKLIQAFFEEIIISKTEDGKGIEILEFSLNPVFKLAYNKKVLCNGENTGNNKNTASNLQDGLKQTKKAQSEDYALDGRPTRNRT